MTLPARRLLRLTVIASLSIATIRTPLLHAHQPIDAIVASGTLEGHLLTGSLFHIGEFWIRVAGGTEFNRWLSQALDRTLVVRLAADAARVGDDGNSRILSGRLIHQTAPTETPATSDVVGRLPAGDSGFVHVFFVEDEIAGRATLGAVTFESADLATVSKFSAYDGSHVNIIIEIR